MDAQRPPLSGNGRPLMISGRQALAIIEQTIASARSGQDRLDAALRSASEKAVRLRAERMELFRELARLKLDILARDAVSHQLSAAEQRALLVFEQQQRAFEELSKRRQAAQQEMQTAEAERHERAAEVEKLLENSADLRARVELESKLNAKWVEQRARLDALSGTVKEAERKLIRADADREEKRKPYETDPLFWYLWQAGFGTAAYKAGSLARFLDRGIARLIGYDRAQVNYALLSEIPQWLRAHLDRLRKDTKAAAEELQRLERSALEEAGLGQVVSRLRQARQALEYADRRLAQARDTLSAVDREHAAYVLEGEAPHGPAVELLAKANAGRDLQALYDQALKTPSPQDERVVQQIKVAETSIGQVEEEIGRIREEIRDLAQRRSQIEQERDEFRQRGYDRPGSMFRNERVLADVLSAVLGGGVQGTKLREVMNQGHEQRSHKSSEFGGPWG